jgi:hypothetical protein|tara:strand:- start:360 stop:1052 length:693 start_codon:yes stop_codon:yes gene_type:complete
MSERSNIPTIRDLVDYIKPQFHFVTMNDSLNKVISFMVSKDIGACPVVSNYNKKNNTSRSIKGYALLGSLALKMNEHGDACIKDFMVRKQWELYDYDNIVEKISVLFRKPVFCIKDNHGIVYTTIYPTQVSHYMFSFLEPYFYLMNIENKIGVLINNNSEESNLSDLPMGKKIKLLFSDEVWNALDTTIDECILKPMLDQVAEQRNRFFHHRNDKTDLKLLKRVWDLLNA